MLDPKRAGDFLTHCVPAHILFGLIIGEGYPKIPRKPERLGPIDVQSVPEIAGFGLFRVPFRSDWQRNSRIFRLPAGQDLRVPRREGGEFFRTQIVAARCDGFIPLD